MQIWESVDYAAEKLSDEFTVKGSTDFQFSDSVCEQLLFFCIEN